MRIDFREIICVVVLLVLASLWVADSHAGELPDAQFTPGVARTVSVQELCTTSTKLVRHTSAATKAEVYKEYGIEPKHAPECSGPGHACYEVDHLISLEIGGADVKGNLWPQLYDGPDNAHDKDLLENHLHKLICSNVMTLEAAQACISTNWIQCAAEVMSK